MSQFSKMFESNLTNTKMDVEDENFMKLTEHKRERKDTK
jgi:hypothetical protein